MNNHQKTKTPLETALVAAAFDPSSRPFFYRNLQGFDAFVASRKKPSSPSSVSFIRVQRGSGAQAAPHVAVFSSPEMVPSEFSPIKIKMGDLFRVVRGTPVSLNPDQAATKDFSADEIESILTGELSKIPPPDPSSPLPPGKKLAPPSEHLPECWGSLGELLKDHPGITAAWGAEFGSLPRPSAVVWLAAQSREQWNDAAAECKVMMTTLSDPPATVLMQMGPPPPGNPAQRVYLQE